MVGPKDSFRMGNDHTRKTDNVVRELGLGATCYLPDFLTSRDGRGAGN